MSMIFPGMDPYLEDPLLWRGVHLSFVVYIADQLQPQLRPRYVASVERRIYPESGNGEANIEILDVHSGQELVTLIEVTSPTSKVEGPGRDSYLTKQNDIRGSQVHLVEIDLLRIGTHLLAVPESAVRDKWLYDYLISVNRAAPDRSLFDVYPRLLRQRLPRIRIPLADGDPDVRLDVQAAVAQVYEAGCYRDRIDYSRTCQPPLSDADQAWAFELTCKAPA